jgi:hypothetical protein
MLSSGRIAHISDVLFKMFVGKNINNVFICAEQSVLSLLVRSDYRKGLVIKFIEHLKIVAASN